MTNEIPQCIHIPDGSVVVSGELFDMACAAINERDKLLAEIERLTGQLNFANREPPHCPSCNCGSDEPCEQRARPLEAETRAATSRKVPSTEDAGRPPPTEGASRDAPGVVQRVCHALTDNCVMFTDPERPPCTPENCKAVKASRDASSTCPSIHDHMWRPAQHGEYCIRCNAQRT